MNRPVGFVTKDLQLPMTDAHRVMIQPMGDRYAVGLAVVNATGQLVHAVCVAAGLNREQVGQLLAESLPEQR